jgi:hypothetical protein
MQFNVLQHVKTSGVISHVNAELKTKVSQIFSVSIIRVDGAWLWNEINCSLIGDAVLEVYIC